jgi:hypothetical protein
MRVLHLFRRTPAVSVTVGAADPARTAATFYGGCLGMRHVTAEEELAELHLPQPAPAGSGPGPERAILAFGPAHSTSCLVVERAGLTGTAAPAEDAGAGAAPVLGLALPLAQLPQAHARVVALGLPASPFDPSRHSSFTCVDPDGLVVQVLAAETAV